MSAIVPGMRVVLTEGPWTTKHRIAGHYGKVTHVNQPKDDDDAFIRVDITGHIDGQPPIDFVSADMEWFYPEELTVVD